MRLEFLADGPFVPRIGAVFLMLVSPPEGMSF